ncbi:MAG: MBL fold metallo-hydrolase [Endomicrobia bacterium]|nr:MBL fold metallo-hydrolase [Endomicrobiia bacterium]
MKKTAIICLVFVCVISFLYAGAYAENKKEPRMFKFGKAEVWAIADSIRKSDPGIFSVGPEVYEKYLKSGSLESAVMTFIIKTGNDIILVDTGFGNKESMLMDGLGKAGIKPEDITIVLITHMHRDHIGGLLFEDKIAFPNAKVKIGRIERDFWIDDKSVGQFPDRKANFELAKKVAEAYGSAVEIFEFGAEVAPGITAIDASGHTPGQTSYILESNGKKIQFIGDIINAPFLQLPRPDISSRFDMNPEKAALTREKILSEAAKNKTEIAGAHIAFPGIARIKRDGKQGFEYKLK